MIIRKEMTTNDNVRLIVIKDNDQFWWFNFHQKNKLFGHSDGRGNAQKYYKEVKMFLFSE